MKTLHYILLLVFSFLSIQVVSAQDQDATDEAIIEMKDADTQPFFYAGTDALYEFIEQNFKKPEVPELIGKIFVSFVVEKDGTLSDITTIRDVGFGTGAEAERVIQLSPRWVPGIKAGKTVRVKLYLAIPIHTN